MTGLIGRALIAIVCRLNAAAKAKDHVLGPKPIDTPLPDVYDLEAEQDVAMRIAATGFECLDPACDICKASTHDALIKAVQDEIARMPRSARSTR